MRLSDEHIMIRDMMRNFTEKEIKPIAPKMDREHFFPKEFFVKWGELGILGVTIPAEHGGAGLDSLSQVLIGEELAKGDAGIALTYLAHSNLCVHNLYKNGSDYLCKRYLGPLCSGAKVGALALTEPGAGSDAVGIQTAAVLEGDHYRLNGTKMFITNGPIADVIIVYTKTDKAKMAHGITAFVVESNYDGFSVSRKLEKMGCNSSPTGELVMEDCLVPSKNILGKENHGVAVMMSGLDTERVVVAAVSLGIAEAAFEASIKYAKERVQFGKPIAQFQLIQAKLADMYTGIEAARLMIYDTATRSAKENKLRKESAAAVLFSAEMATKTCLEAIQIHGGYGYMLEYPVNRYLRDAKIMEIGAGTSEIRRLLIARELLAHN